MFGGASARIEMYSKDIDDRLLPTLRQKFGGIRMIVVWVHPNQNWNFI